MKDTLSNTEKKTAYILTLPAVALVFAIILFPIFANVWISFKEVELKDIRIPEPKAKKIVKSVSEDPSKIKILYKLRNSSLLQEVRDVS
jgi:multiple sugar transport system permease protein